MFKHTIIVKTKLLLFVLTYLLFGISSSYAFMKSSSDWQISPYSKARLHLIDSDDQTLNFAIEIELAEKYKTYWHVPGSNGVPPIIEVSGQNVLSTEPKLQLPLPKIFKNEYGVTFGYKDRTAFYFSIDRAQTNIKTNLKIDFHYATCDIICLPVSTSFSMDVAQGKQFKSVMALQLKAFEKAIPRSVDGNLVESFEIDKTQKTLRIRLAKTVDLNSDLFIQDQKSRYYKLISAANNILEFKILGSKLDNWSADQINLYFKNGDAPIKTTLISSK